MRRDSEVNTRFSKQNARDKYKERQINKFLKWCIESKGYIKWKDLVAVHDEYNIKVNG